MNQAWNKHETDMKHSEHIGNNQETKSKQAWNKHETNTEQIGAKHETSRKQT